MTHEQYVAEMMRLYKAMEWATVQRFGRGDGAGKDAGVTMHFALGVLFDASKRIDAPPAIDGPVTLRLVGRRAR